MPLEMKASKLWENASNPVMAVAEAGRVSMSSGSTIAAFAKMLGCQSADLSLSFSLVMTAQGVVWEPVPERGSGADYGKGACAWCLFVEQIVPAGPLMRRLNSNCFGGVHAGATSKAKDKVGSFIAGYP